MEDQAITVSVRASKTSPHPGQKFPRHLFTLMCTQEEFEKLWGGWTCMPVNHKAAQQMYLARTQGELILVNPLDPIRIKHYDAVPFMMREDTQNAGRMRGSVSSNQAPWLVEVEAQGLSDAELLLQPTTDNYLLTWKRKVAPKRLKRAQQVGRALSLMSAGVVKIDGLAPMAPPVSAPANNRVELQFSDGSTRLFEDLTLAQMLEINVLLARYEDES